MNIKEKIQQYKEKRKLIIEGQKKLIVETISRNWSESEILQYNMQYNIPATSYGLSYMNEEQIKLHILRFNRSLFTNEEISQLLDIIFKINVKETKRTK